MVTLICLGVLVSGANSPAVQQIGLEGAWRLTQTEKKIDVPAAVPGMVQSDLLRAGLIPDPFYRDNSNRVQWVGEQDWSYSRTFIVGPGFLQCRHVVLRCEGLDTLATVSLNGTKLAGTDNMFRTWEFDARSFLRPGTNRIQVDFKPVEPFLKAHQVQAAFPGKSVGGWGYIRKAPFQNGWDFAPKLVTYGIWRKIGLLGWDEGRLTDLEIDQDHQAPDQVKLAVKVSASSGPGEMAKAVVSFHGRPITSGTARLVSGRAELSLTIRHPQLWWPVDMGPHNLYEVRLNLLNSHGVMLDQTERSIGLRTIRWRPKTVNSPLTLEVNGRPFFAKGSNLVPVDAIPTQATPATERRLVEQAVSAHMNLLRLWGGSFYEDDAFFDACDEKGLLCWFEFKFADAAYPSFDPAWLANVTAEAEDNVRRVRHHACLAVYSGNNEVIGFVADKSDPDHMSRSDYDLLFHKTLADVVARLAPGSAYTPGSPEIGDEHDWNVWHGSSSFKSYRDVHGFLSEFGFQAFPVPSSVDRFTVQEDRTSVLSPVMEAHQKNWRDGNNLIVSTFRRSYLKPKDFDSALWLSQIQQATGIATGVEHWRRDWPRSSGSLVWQFNDCWPSVSWSMVDYYGQPKALYYRLKRAYAPVAISGLVDGSGRCQLWAVNDRPTPLLAKVSWDLLDANGKTLRSGTIRATLPAGESSIKLGEIDAGSEIQKFGKQTIFVSARLVAEGEPASEATVAFCEPKDLKLQPPNLQAHVSPDVSGGYRVTLEAARPAFSAWIEFKGYSAKLSDNFIDVMPHHPVSIVVQRQGQGSLIKFASSLQVRSLIDTFAPGTQAVTMVHALADGSILATADDAEIVGDGPILEGGNPSNIGNWTDPGDWLRWAVADAKPGTYRVQASVSIPANEAGSRFTMSVDGSEVTGIVPGTPGWTDYVTISLGTVRVSHSGQIEVTLKPTNMPHEHVMNLQSVLLEPVD